jgi:copper chaperone
MPVTTSTYTVAGMTCAHCVNAVRQELGALAGVTDVAVDLATGRVAVTSAAPLDPAEVRAAVDEAGYALAE